MGSGAGRPVSGIDRVGTPLEVLRKSCNRPFLLLHLLPYTSKPGTYLAQAGNCLLFPSTFTLVPQSQ